MRRAGEGSSSTPEKSEPPTPAVRQRLQPSSNTPVAANTVNPAPPSAISLNNPISAADLASKFGSGITPNQPVLTRTDKMVDSSGNVVTRTVYQITSFDNSQEQSGAVVDRSQKPNDPTIARTVVQRSQKPENSTAKTQVSSQVSKKPPETNVIHTAGKKPVSSESRKDDPANMIYATPAHQQQKAGTTPVALPTSTTVGSSKPTSFVNPDIDTGAKKPIPNVQVRPSEPAIRSGATKENSQASKSEGSPKSNVKINDTDKTDVSSTVSTKKEKIDSGASSAVSNVPSPKTPQTFTANKESTLETDKLATNVQKITSFNDKQPANTQQSEPRANGNVSKKNAESGVALDPQQSAQNSKIPDDMKAKANMINLPIIGGGKNGNNYNTIDHPDEYPSGNGKSYSLQLPADLNPPTRPYPKKVFFIVGNEFCERFSYYGLRTVLVLYLRQVLGLSDADSTIFFHLFAALCYITPIFGAILADTVWGKYRTILNLSIVYLIGENILLLGSIYWDSKGFCYGCTGIGLLLIGLGTGGIKPCVAAIGADQFYESEVERRQAFFSMFYGAINCGAVISSFLTPLLRSQFHCVDRSDCFPFAFGVPAVLMFISIIVIVSARDQYYLAPLPPKNVVTTFCQCTWLALKRKYSGYRPGDALSKSSRDHSGSASNASLDVASYQDDVEPVIKGESSKKQLPNGDGYQMSEIGDFKTTSDDQLLEDKKEHWLYLAKDKFDTKSIEDFRALLRIFLLMAPLPIYWTLYDQQGSMWTLQANRMDGAVFGSPDFVVQPDQMTFLNSLLIIIGIPIFQYIIYPVLAKFGMLTSPISRITVGGLLASLAFVLCACVEIGIQNRLPTNAIDSDDANFLVLNGLNGCSMNNSAISNLQYPATHMNDTLMNHHLRARRSLDEPAHSSAQSLNWKPFGHVNPLSSKYLTIPSSTDPYHLKFNLASANSRRDGLSECQFDPNVDQRLTIEPLMPGTIKLLYLEQGNGRLSYRIFEEKIELPEPGKARVRLLYSSFGSPKVAEKRRFHLVPVKTTHGIIPARDPVEHYKPLHSTEDGKKERSPRMMRPVPHPDIAGLADGMATHLPDRVHSFHPNTDSSRRLGDDEQGQHFFPEHHSRPIPNHRDEDHPSLLHNAAQIPDSLLHQTEKDPSRHPPIADLSLQPTDHVQDRSDSQPGHAPSYDGHSQQYTTPPKHFSKHESGSTLRQHPKGQRPIDLPDEQLSKRHHVPNGILESSTLPSGDRHQHLNLSRLANHHEDHTERDARGRNLEQDKFGALSAPEQHSSRSPAHSPIHLQRDGASDFIRESSTLPSVASPDLRHSMQNHLDHSTKMNGPTHSSDYRNDNDLLDSEASKQALEHELKDRFETNHQLRGLASDQKKQFPEREHLGHLHPKMIQHQPRELSSHRPVFEPHLDRDIAIPHVDNKHPHLPHVDHSEHHEPVRHISGEQNHHQAANEPISSAEDRPRILIGIPEHSTQLPHISHFPHHENLQPITEDRGSHQGLNKSGHPVFLQQTSHDHSESSGRDHHEYGVDGMRLRPIGRSLSSEYLQQEDKDKHLPRFANHQERVIEEEEKPMRMPQQALEDNQLKQAPVKNQFTQQPIQRQSKDQPEGTHMPNLPTPRKIDDDTNDRNKPILAIGIKPNVAQTEESLSRNNISPHFSDTGEEPRHLADNEPSSRSHYENFIHRAPPSIDDNERSQLHHAAMKPTLEQHHPGHELGQHASLQPDSDVFARRFGEDHKGHMAELPGESVKHLDERETKRQTGRESRLPLEFKPAEKDGQVILSDYLDVDVPPEGMIVRLVANESSPLDISPHEDGQEIFLKPGTRNLLTLNQMNSTHAEVNHDILQDNDYRINMLYQVPAIVVLTASEILFSITASEVSYAMAPDSMKSVVMAANCLTVGIGNLLTVFIQAILPFSSLVGNFFFYSALMVLDMIVFAVIGFYYYQPRKAYIEIQ